MLRGLILGSLSIISVVASAADAKIDPATAYSACTNAFHTSGKDIGGVLVACEDAAKMGVPGAQYVMGALLTNRGEGDDLITGIAWLEKAVASGHPAAAYHLGGMLIQSEKTAPRARGLLKLAICAGYPPAVQELAAAGVDKSTMQCSPPTDSDFSGDWLLSLRWDPSAEPEELTESYKISIREGVVSVFFREGDEWIEAKPGRFSFSQLDQSATVAVTDSGWDFDGKWIESWTIQLMRTGRDEADVAYLRTVNNPQLPHAFSWRTFSSFAEGYARRVPAAQDDSGR